jgi:hypothetical protein
MNEVKHWDSLQSFFSYLNEKEEYLVLRNYEELLDRGLPDIHSDIDVLCEDADSFIDSARAVPRTKNKKDRVHQKVLIGDKYVSLDVRYVGDGYYDKNWEAEMLNRRGLTDDFCYTMDKENYFYSLMYHAIIQKHSISDEYKARLKRMSMDMGVSADTESDYLAILQEYMRRKKYFFTYPNYPGGIANFSKVDRTLIQVDIKRILKRKIYRLKQTIKSLIRQWEKN